MSKIILIQCVAKQKATKDKAKNIYQSAYFKKSLSYAKTLQPDENKIFILSSKYGLLGLNDEIEPYNVTFSSSLAKKHGALFLNKSEREDWVKKVVNSLQLKTNINSDEFIILTGKDYYKDIIDFLPNHKLPVDGLGIGEKMQFFDRESSNK